MVASLGPGSQPVIDRHFRSAAAYWHEVYGEEGLRGRIYRERMEAVLRWVQDLGLPAQAAALEVGCGAGLLAARLAQRDLRVVGVDASAEMVKLAERHAAEVGSNGRLRVMQADVYRLPFASETFDLVLAVGLLPWLHDAQTGMAEMTRVLRGGGWLIVTADNRARLNLLTEPRENPVLAPLKPVARGLKRALGKRGSPAASHLHLPSHVDRLLVGAGVRPVRRTTIGFGPFTVLGHAALSEPAGLRLHLTLSALSAKRMPRLRRMGWHYLVAARKPER
jgi:ubiquinone/menaquinone biosynthesis C-methylase UbiE